MSSTIESLVMQESLFDANTEFHFLVKEQTPNSSIILTLPGQSLKSKRGPDKPIVAHIMVQPTKELAGAFKAVRKTVPAGTVFVTKSLKPSRKGHASFYSCSDLWLLNNCPEHIKELYYKLISSS